MREIFIYRSRFQPGIADPHIYALLWLVDRFQIETRSPHKNIMLGVVGLLQNGKGRFDPRMNPKKEIEIVFDILEKITTGLEVQSNVLLPRVLSLEKDAREKIGKVDAAFMYFPMPPIYDHNSYRETGKEPYDLFTVMMQRQDGTPTDVRKHYKGWLEKLLLSDPDLVVNWYFPIYDASDVKDMMALEVFHSGRKDRERMFLKNGLKFVSANFRDFRRLTEAIEDSNKTDVMSIYFVRFNASAMKDTYGWAQYEGDIVAGTLTFGAYLGILSEYARKHQSYGKLFRSFEEYLTRHGVSDPAVLEMTFPDHEKYPFIYTYKDFKQIAESLGIECQEIKQGDTYEDILREFYRFLRIRESRRDCKRTREVKKYNDKVKLTMMTYSEFLKYLVSFIEKRILEKYRDRYRGVATLSRETRRCLGNIEQKIEEVEAIKRDVERITRLVGNAYSIFSRFSQDSEDIQDTFNKALIELLCGARGDESVMLLRRVLENAQLSYIWGNGSDFFWLEDSFASNLKASIVSMIN